VKEIYIGEEDDDGQGQGEVNRRSTLKFSYGNIIGAFIPTTLIFKAPEKNYFNVRYYDEIEDNVF
jgi:hypothetical protein